MGFEYSIIPAEARMAELFDLTQGHDLLEATFYGKVTCAGDFIQLMRLAHLYAVICDGELVGYSWVNMFSGRSAAVHVCLFPTAPTEKRIPMGKAFLRYLLFSKDDEGQYYRDSLVGLVPVTHRHVEIYGISIGMNYLGTIPAAIEVMGEVADVAVLTVVREDLMEG